MNETIKLKNGITVNITKDSKFHEVYMTLKLVFDLDEEVATKANILSRMMDDRLTSEQTKSEVTRREDMMFGARRHVSTYSCGKYQVIDIGVKAIDEKFTGASILQKQADLLVDTLLDPLLNIETMLEAKRNFKHSHSRLLENPAQLAVVTAFKEAGKDQKFGLSSFGDIDKVDAIKLNEIIDLHNDLVKNASKIIYCVGDIEHVPDFSKLGILDNNDIDNALIETQINETYKEVFRKGNQTDLVMIFDTKIKPGHNLYYAYLVFVAYLGQLPNSLLFQNVREKHSLCYSIYASRQMFDGVFYIATGIKDSNLEKAQTLIMEQFEIIKEASLDLDGAKTYLSLSLESTMEHIKRIADHQFRNDMLCHSDSIEKIQCGIRDVTQDDVKKVLELISKPYTYAQRGITDEKK